MDAKIPGAEKTRNPAEFRPKIRLQQQYAADDAQQNRQPEVLRKLKADCFVIACAVVMTDDGGEPLQYAHQSEKNHDGGRTAQSDDGKMLFAEVAGHQGVDCGCAHQRQIGDEDWGGEFGKRPEADIGLGGVVRNDFRVFVVGFDGFAHTKKDSRKGNPGERRRLWKTPQTFGVDIPQVESTFGLLC